MEVLSILHNNGARIRIPILRNELDIPSLPGLGDAYSLYCLGIEGE